MRTLADVLTDLERFEHAVDLATLQKLLNQLSVTPEELEQWTYFSDERYQRNLIQRTPAAEVLLLCFQPGQRTPIHDHAGSACGVKVIQGTATETSFARTPLGWIYATGSCDLDPGGVCGSHDMDTHQLSNLQADGETLITMHVYSPPLGEVGNYSLDNNEVQQVRSPVRSVSATANESS